MIGKGGYGKVFHCQHRLDGGHYAVKKIVLSSSRLQRIQHRGPVELDTLLTELRTLAKMEHPNIVRYYAGWLEYCAPGVPARSQPRIPSAERRLLEAPKR